MREKTFKARNFFDGGIFDSKIIQSLGGKGDTKIEIWKISGFFKRFLAKSSKQKNAQENGPFLPSWNSLHEYHFSIDVTVEFWPRKFVKNLLLKEENFGNFF